MVSHLTELRSPKPDGWLSDEIAQYAREMTVEDKKFSRFSALNASTFSVPEGSMLLRDIVSQQERIEGAERVALTKMVRLEDYLRRIRTLAEEHIKKLGTEISQLEARAQYAQRGGQLAEAKSVVEESSRKRAERQEAAKLLQEIGRIRKEFKKGAVINIRYNRIVKKNA